MHCLSPILLRYALQVHYILFNIQVVGSVTKSTLSMLSYTKYS